MAARESAREGVPVNVENLALTNGSMQAVTLVGQALMQDRGDVVITENFTYSGTLSAYRGIGLDIVGIGMDEQGMRMDLLESALESLRREGRRVRFIYTLTTYQNPTGTCLPLDRRRTLIDLARAYVDMGDPSGAKSILEEVLEEGDEGQRQQAQQLLDSL